MRKFTSLVLGIIIGSVVVLLGQKLVEFNIPLILGILIGIIVTLMLGFFGFIILNKEKRNVAQEKQKLINTINEIVKNQLPKGSKHRILTPASINIITKVFALRTYLSTVSMLFIGIGSLIGGVLLINQNKLINHQNSIIENQLQLEEASRRSSLQFMLSGIMDKMQLELEDSINNPNRELSEELINRISSLTYGFKPYKFLESNQMVSNQLSPERGQLFFTLINSNINTEQIMQLTQKSNFRFSDLKTMNLSNKQILSSNLDNSDLSNVSAINSLIQNINLNNSICSSSNFSISIFRQVRITNSDLTSANFKDADLRGLEIKDSKLLNVNLTNSWISSPKWFNELIENNHTSKTYLLKNYEPDNSINYDSLGNEYFILKLKDRYEDECTGEGKLYLTDKIAPINYTYNLDNNSNILNGTLLAYADILKDSKKISSEERSNILKNYHYRNSGAPKYYVQLSFTDTVYMLAAYNKIIGVDRLQENNKILRLSATVEDKNTTLPLIAISSFESKEHAISYLRLLVQATHIRNMKDDFRMLMFTETKWQRFYSGAFNYGELEKFDYKFDYKINWDDVK